MICSRFGRVTHTRTHARTHARGLATERCARRRRFFAHYSCLSRRAHRPQRCTWAASVPGSRLPCPHPPGPCHTRPCVSSNAVPVPRLRGCRGLWQYPPAACGAEGSSPPSDLHRSSFDGHFGCERLARNAGSHHPAAVLATAPVGKMCKPTVPPRTQRLHCGNGSIFAKNQICGLKIRATQGFKWGNRRFLCKPYNPRPSPVRHHPTPLLVEQQHCPAIQPAPGGWRVLLLGGAWRLLTR